MRDEIRRWRDARRSFEAPQASLGPRRMSIDDREVIVLRRRAVRSAPSAAPVRPAR